MTNRGIRYVVEVKANLKNQTNPKGLAWLPLQLWQNRVNTFC